jgi:hypothetical protein
MICRREKLELERGIERISQEVVSLRRKVRALEGNSLNPGAKPSGYAVLDR